MVSTGTDSNHTLHRIRKANQLTYHRKDLHAGQDGVQPNVLVAMVDVLIGNEGVGQTAQTGKVGRIGFDGRILQLLDDIPQAFDQVVLSSWFW